MARNSTPSEISTLQGQIGAINDLLHNVDALAAYGVKVPEGFTKVRTAWDAVSLNPDLMQRKLAEAVAAGRVDEVPELLTAVAISRNTNLPEIRKAVAGDARKAMVSIWRSEAAEAAYEKIAAAFNAEARKLTECASIVNVMASAESIVRDRLDKEQHDAWLSARQHAARLDELLEPLRIAGELLPIPSNQRQWGLLDGKMHDWLLALTVDPGVAHRRKVWSAWESRGECGRWGALLDLGVVLRAHPDPLNFEMYHRPQPVEVRQERALAGGIWGVRQTKVDPEDAAYAARLAAPSSSDAEA